jgi:hypothetical protein
MELEIDPEPTADERTAIEQALAPAGVDQERRPGRRGAWWRAGIDEALSSDDPGDTRGGHW